MSQKSPLSSVLIFCSRMNVNKAQRAPSFTIFGPMRHLLKEKYFKSLLRFLSFRFSADFRRPSLFIIYKTTSKAFFDSRCNTIFFKNSYFTNPLPFETEPHIVHTIPLAREHFDSYLYYIRYRTLEITPSQHIRFKIFFNSVSTINTGILS